MLRVLASICCLAIALAALAQGNNPVRPPVDPLRETGRLYTLVGTSDCIAVATVTDVVLPPEPEEAPGDPIGGSGFRGNYKQQTATATITVDKVLKGTVVAGEKMTVNVPVYPRYEATPDGTRAFAGYSLQLAPKDQRVFVLTQGTEGYRTGGGGTDILPIADQQKIADAIDALPVTISITAAPKAYAFGKPNSIKISVKNTAATSVSITNVSMSGEMYAKKLGPYVGFNASAGPKDEPSTLPTFAKPLEIKAGETKEIAGFVSTIAPPAWALFDEECRLVTPARVRATVSCSIGMAPGGGAMAGNAIRFNVSTPASLVYVGHALTF